MMTIEEAIEIVQRFSQEYLSYKLGGEFACAVETLVNHYNGANDSDDP